MCGVIERALACEEIGYIIDFYVEEFLCVRVEYQFPGCSPSD